MNKKSKFCYWEEIFIKILGIETSCDDTSVSIVENGRLVLALQTFSQTEKHKIYGGVVPEIASRCHVEIISSLTEKAFIEAKMNFDDIDAIAVTSSPGLIGSLLVGINFAKGLSLALKKPLISVNHLRGHIASNYLTHENLEPPFLCLVVSGGHTIIVDVINYTKMKIIGKTRDDSAGEAFDKGARCLGFEYPGGAKIDFVAKNGKDDFINFPRPKVTNGEFDFSFSGLKTAIKNEVTKLQNYSDDLPIPDIAASFQKSIVDCLTQKLIRAAIKLHHNKIVIAGGVSANSSLQKRLQKECENHNFKLYIPKMQLCGDNAAMIASQAYYEHLDNNLSNLYLNAIVSKLTNSI